MFLLQLVTEYAAGIIQRKTSQVKHSPKRR